MPARARTGQREFRKKFLKRIQTTMEVLSYIMIALVVVLFVLLVVMIHSGVFYRLSIRTSVPLTIPSRIAYKVYKGPYRNAGTGFEDIMQRAPGYTRLFGVYYDNPEKVDLSCSIAHILISDAAVN